METSSATTHRRSAVFLDGGRDIVSLSVGYVPMGLAIGTTISNLPIDNLAAWSGAPLIAAGAAHFALIESLAGGAGIGAAVLAAALINLRLVAYSAGLAPRFRGQPTSTRLLVSFFTIDATYLLAEQRYNTDDPGPKLRKWYVYGMGAVLYPIWAGAVAVGVGVGANIPASLRLDNAATFMLIGLLALSLGDRPQRMAAITGTIVALVGSGLPTVLIPVLAGSAAVIVFALTDRRPTPEPAVLATDLDLNDDRQEVAP